MFGPHPPYGNAVCWFGVFEAAFPGAVCGRITQNRRASFPLPVRECEVRCPEIRLPYFGRCFPCEPVQELKFGYARPRLCG